MTKYQVHAFAIVAIFNLVFFNSCITKCPKCHSDEEIISCMKNAVPYQVGDTIRFANDINEILTFVCEEKKYYQIEHLPNNDSEDSECCPNYFVENISCKLMSEDGSINIKTNNDELPYVLTIRLNYKNIIVSNANFYEGQCNYYEESLTIAQTNFKNVIKLYLPTSTNSDSIYLQNLESAGGVIGFKLDGIEWAKVQ